MAKRNDWPERLVAFIESRRHEPFQWGVNDCALFAADCLLELTGVDHAAGFRGYRTQKGAARRISRVGGMSSFANGLAEKDVRFASRGDVVLALVEGRETFGICIGGGHWCAPGPTGLVFRPMTDVIQVFES